eukprot:TRINITY_DN4760_c0_g1_i1.p1 TRINITY_DN4760_c0_g1~~TRINITY_DN4760_c0_g1_i1.p1  ORF type:complete len:121 (+),score=18.76 TRINITY_DN4760_c0_g1_i1:52-363(+)
MPALNHAVPLVVAPKERLGLPLGGSAKPSPLHQTVYKIRQQLQQNLGFLSALAVVLCSVCPDQLHQQQPQCDHLLYQTLQMVERSRAEVMKALELLQVLAPQL